MFGKKRKRPEPVPAESAGPSADRLSWIERTDADRSDAVGEAAPSGAAAHGSDGAHASEGTDALGGLNAAGGSTPLPVISREAATAETPPTGPVVGPATSSVHATSSPTDDAARLRLAASLTPYRGGPEDVTPSVQEESEAGAPGLARVSTPTPRVSRETIAVVSDRGSDPAGTLSDLDGLAREGAGAAMADVSRGTSAPDATRASHAHVATKSLATAPGRDDRGDKTSEGPIADMDGRETADRLTPTEDGRTGASSVGLTRRSAHAVPPDGVRREGDAEVPEASTAEVLEDSPDRITERAAAITSPRRPDVESDDLRRAALVQSLPPVSEDTPLMAELHQDARRRIELRGRRFPRPATTRIMTVANQKGGVGKTTTAVNLAAALAQSGLTVLVLDNDPQGNASTALGVDHRAGTPSIYEVLIDDLPMEKAVQESPEIPGLWCLPATIDLSGAEIELVSMVARETRLRTALDRYLAWRTANGLPDVDYVLVDCPPSLGLLTVNAFVVAREVLIPIQCEYYALEGLSQLLKTIQLIQAHLNPTLHVSTILLTMYDARTNLAQQVAAEVRQHFPERTLRTTVPRSVRISEAPSYGQTVMTYDPGSSGALAYLEAAREVAERGAMHDERSTNGVSVMAAAQEEER